MADRRRYDLAEILTAVAVMVIALVVVPILVLQQSGPAPAQQARLIEAVPFAWEIVNQNSDPSGQWLTLRYEDGRQSALKLTSISRATYFPQEFARAMGLKNPYIEVSSGPEVRRIDLASDNEAERLYSALFVGAIGDISSE